MFLLDDRVIWSASDLSLATECEFALLRALDYKLGRAEPLEHVDPLMDRIAALGDQHEARILTALEASSTVASVDRASAMTRAGIEDVRERTIQAFASDADVVYQAAFFDGDFFGYADFVERSDAGWLVTDAKLARSAKPKALIQLAAYAEQILALNLPLAPTVALLLGSGNREEFRIDDLLPVFRERRSRLLALLDEHRNSNSAIAWGANGFVACGRCSECEQAAEEASDVLLVAGMRLDHRRTLQTTGIYTLSDLAGATATPDTMALATFASLRTQAKLQWDQIQAGEDAPLSHVLTADAATTLARLPAPSVGDIFFDFEGDPMYHEGDPKKSGLEYLWGILHADGTFAPLWAHSAVEEKAAFITFMDMAAQRRATYPDMHIFHYAAYEVTALKRLAGRYQTHEAELDDLLRNEVFVDLYPVVRGSIRAGVSSYSIKYLEPLYMGDEVRDMDGVVAGGESIVAYHEFRDLQVHDAFAAQATLEELATYNHFDCHSTLRLRDWLLDRATEAGVRDQILPRTGRVEPDEPPDDEAQDRSLRDLFDSLMQRAEPARGLVRTAEQQAFALLATALEYYWRESKQFWWAHYTRLDHPVDDWPDTRDVFTIHTARVVQDWIIPSSRAKLLRREMRLTGQWGSGSTTRGSTLAIYAAPVPAGVIASDGAFYGYTKRKSKIEPIDGDASAFLLTESRATDELTSLHPVALTPTAPPGTKEIAAAVRHVAETSLTGDGLPNSAALDILARRNPRLHMSASLPSKGDPVVDVTEALVEMEDSYIAVQGPPGTGKTFVGARVIKALVEQHHWRVGILAQSHAAVENLLSEVVRAGLDPSLVGKSDNKMETPTWTQLPDQNVDARVAFLSQHASTGCLLGGTVWTFTSGKLLSEGPLDLLVIDEAGQFSLAPTIGASACAMRLLLLGDPQQLPQVTQGSHAEPVDESALGWLMEGHDTLPAEMGYFLADSYRMHPALCASVSALSYEGRLHSANPASARRLEGVEPGLEVVNVDHSGNRVQSVEEAREVCQQVQSLLGAMWSDLGDEATVRPLVESDFLVVAPYNAQVALIREELDANDLSGVRVGTVDKFQGQEAVIAIVSMTASAQADVPRGMGFLINRNRVNVAVSRAQWKAILIRSRALTSFMPTSVEGLLELGAFIGLCAPSGRRSDLQSNRKNE